MSTRSWWHCRAKTSTIGTAMVLSVASALACQSSPENGPITTTSPAGQSTAVGADAAARADDALIRFVHALPAGATLDLYADETRAFEGVAFRGVTPYRQVDAQRYTYRVRPAGLAQSEPLASSSEGLDDGSYYTVFAVPDADQSVVLRVVADDFSRPPAGKARVRVVHAAVDVGVLDVYASGRDGELFDGVDVQSITGYEEFDPWKGSLDLRADNQPASLATVANVAFEAGRIYTVVVTGKRQGAPPLAAFVIEDQIGTTTTGAR